MLKTKLETAYHEEENAAMQQVDGGKQVATERRDRGASTDGLCRGGISATGS